MTIFVVEGVVSAFLKYASKDLKIILITKKYFPLLRIINIVYMN